MESQEMVNSLIARYQEIMQTKETKPEWALHKKNSPNELVPCTIPFVGKYYGEKYPKILVYASAEVLTDYYSDNKGGWLDDDELAKNRHRKYFDDLSNDNKSFPYVHIEPFNNGSLATAVMYIASKIYDIGETTTPRKFYETIAFGNYCKYTVETDQQRSKRTKHQYEKASSRNIDYADNREKLFQSVEYVRADIEILDPDYIIMPKSIYNNEKQFIDGIARDTVIIPIYQMNARVINLHVSGKYNKREREELSQFILSAVDNIKDINLDNYLCVFDYLDECYSQAETKN